MSKGVIFLLSQRSAGRKQEATNVHFQAVILFFRWQVVMDTFLHQLKKNVGVKICFGSQLFWGQNCLRVKKNWVKLFWDHKFVGGHNFWGSTFSVSQKNARVGSKDCASRN